MLCRPTGLTLLAIGLLAAAAILAAPAASAASDPFTLGGAEPGRPTDLALTSGTPYRVGALWFPEQSDAWNLWDLDFRHINLRAWIATDDIVPFQGGVVRAWLGWDAASLFRGSPTLGNAFERPSRPLPIRFWLKYGFDDALVGRDIAYAEITWDVYGKLTALDQPTMELFVEVDLRRQFHYAGIEWTSEMITIRAFYSVEQKEWGGTAVVALPLLGHLLTG